MTDLRDLVTDLRERLAVARLGGSEAARTKHTERGKLLARDRVDRLLDPRAPSWSCPMAANGMYGGGDAPSAGIITGMGRVNGRDCVIVANDATVKGGTYYPMTVKKHLRAQEVAPRTTCRASTWSTPVAPSCPSRTRSSRTGSTSDGSSTTRPTCPSVASRRSPRSWGPAPPAAPTSRR